MSITRLDHVGLLVTSVEESARRFSARGIETGAMDEFPGEGTREIYVGADSCDGRVLLIEAMGSGPYRSAMDRRGPGLHHVGLGVPDLPSFVESLRGSGWYLHPVSVSSYLDMKTVWLARPGVPILIEVANSDLTSTGDSLITKLALPIPPGLVEALRCPPLVASEGAVMEIGDWKVLPKSICEG